MGLKRPGLARSLVLAAAIGLALPAWAGQPWRYAVDSAASDVRARVAFLGLGGKEARFPQLSGRLALPAEGSTAIDLTVELDARALHADDRVTLNRLKGPDFFDVARHPTVRFVGRSLHMTGENSADVAGELTARGITLPQTLRIRFDRDPRALAPGQPVQLSGRMTVDRRRFGMTAWPLVVGNKVDIAIRTRMTPE